MNETWKDIDGFNNHYQISNMGRVKSKERVVSNACRTYLKKEQILKNQIMKSGYMSIVLRENGKKVLLKIHRLVATAFIPNEDDFPCVNHIDGDKLNNHVENLEWCTVKHNTNHAIATGLKPLVCGRNVQRIFQLRYSDLSAIKAFDSISDLAKNLGCNVSSVHAAIKQKRPYKGYYYIKESDYHIGIDETYFRKLINRKHTISIQGKHVSGAEYSRITGLPRYKVYEMIRKGMLKSEVQE